MCTPKGPNSGLVTWASTTAKKSYYDCLTRECTLAHTVYGDNSTRALRVVIVHYCGQARDHLLERVITIDFMHDNVIVPPTPDPRTLRSFRALLNFDTLDYYHKTSCLACMIILLLHVVDKI